MKVVIRAALIVGFVSCFTAQTAFAVGAGWDTNTAGTITHWHAPGFKPMTDSGISNGALRGLGTTSSGALFDLTPTGLVGVDMSSSNTSIALYYRVQGNGAWMVSGFMNDDAEDTLDGSITNNPLFLSGQIKSAEDKLGGGIKNDMNNPAGGGIGVLSNPIAGVDLGAEMNDIAFLFEGNGQGGTLITGLQKDIADPDWTSATAVFTDFNTQLSLTTASTLFLFNNTNGEYEIDEFALSVQGTASDANTDDSGVGFVPLSGHNFVWTNNFDEPASDPVPEPMTGALALLGLGGLALRRRRA